MPALAASAATIALPPPDCGHRDLLSPRRIEPGECARLAAIVGGARPTAGVHRPSGSSRRRPRTRARDPGPPATSPAPSAAGIHAAPSPARASGTARARAQPRRAAAPRRTIRGPSMPRSTGSIAGDPRRARTSRKCSLGDGAYAAAGPRSGAQHRRRTDAKSSTRSSSGTSTCLGVSPPRSTLSELAMISTPVPRQVGVQVAGGQVEASPGASVTRLSSSAASTPASPG